MAARWEVTVTSFPRRHPRARGDWAGLQFQGLPASDEELFKFHALRSRLREGIRAERDAIAPLSKSVEVSEERIRAGLRQHVVWDEQARSFEEDLARAIAQLRYAQAVARAYPPERTAEGSLLVAKCARDIYLAEAHLDYLRSQLAGLEERLLAMRQELGRDSAELARRKEVLQRLVAQLRQASRHCRQSMCFKRLWPEGWPTPVCACTCGECYKQLRGGSWADQRSTAHHGVAFDELGRMSPSGALFSLQRA